MQQPFIGLIGCGDWGKLILRDLKSLACQVSVVAPSANSQTNAKQCQADRVYSNLQDLLELEEISGFVVATPNETHFEVMQNILQARPKARIFCEKPLVCKTQDASWLQDRYSNQIFVMDKWRYHCGVQKLAEIASSNTLGKILELRTERLGWGIPHAGSGCVWHLMPHDLSIILEILKEVPALHSSLVERRGSTVFGADATMRTVSGIWVRSRVSSHWPVRRREIQLVCEEGIAVLDDGYAKCIRIAKGPLEEGDRIPNYTEIAIEPTLPLYAELQAYVMFLRGLGPAPKSSLSEAFLIVQRIEQILSN